MKAKIIVTGALVAALGLGLVACGGKDEAATATADAPVATEQAATGEFKTLGDVLAAETESMSSTFDDKRYICAFSVDGTWWRVEADLEDGMSDKLNEVWTEDESKVEELLAPIAVTKAEQLEAPSDDELAGYAGKTGADLTADGFTYMVGGAVVNGNETDVTASKGSFDYLVTFDGAIPDEDTDDVASAVADLTVSSVGLQGLSWDALEAE